MSISECPHRRYNPLKDEWLIVAPQRCKRPWSGQVEPSNEQLPPTFDPFNPLCPGVTRSNGEMTPNYDSTYVFTNDFPSFLPEAPEIPKNNEPNELFQCQLINGTCRVMCFHPRSDLQLATMDIKMILDVIEEWIRQMDELGKKYNWVQIFENKGAIVGCSNPHPHCQIWASDFIPNEPATKERTQKSYFARNGRIMLIDYVKQELEQKERIVVENDGFVVVVPYWAMWPYETMLMPKKHIPRMSDLNEQDKKELAEIMKQLLIKYDNLFKCTFSYSMGWHGAPTGSYLDSDCEKYWQLHAVYLPPLLRSASVKKFMAGYELVCEPQRDLTPEMAAKTLRELPDIHFRKQ